eukprot:scaffold67790_cov24-Tisochrysis_lutea.AAC.1
MWLFSSLKGRCPVAGKGKGENRQTNQPRKPKNKEEGTPGGSGRGSGRLMRALATGYRAAGVGSRNSSRWHLHRFLVGGPKLRAGQSPE